MSLLEDIQNSAVDSKSDLGEVLRKCKILAARLGSKPLEDWLIWESNGYPNQVDLPSYRVWRVELKGHFSGPFQSGIRNAPIPTACVPEEFRDSFTMFRCRQSIASIEEMLRSNNSGMFETSSGDLAVVLGPNVYRGMNCLQAWGEFSISHAVGVLNSVRNRILDFALALWKENPEAGSVPTNHEKTQPNRINQIFNTTMYGGTANLVGSANDSTVTFNVETHNFHSLEETLKAAGVSSAELTELKQALDQDPKPSGNARSFGPQVGTWIAKMVGKAATGVWEIGIGTAGNLLATAIARYYGMPA